MTRSRNDRRRGGAAGTGAGFGAAVVFPAGSAGVVGLELLAGRRRTGAAAGFAGGAGFGAFFRRSRRLFSGSGGSIRLSSIAGPGT